MKKFVPLVLASAFAFSNLFAQTQNVGIGTNNPQTKLHVAGAISSTPSALPAGNNVVIPDNVSIFRLTAVAGGGTTALTLTNPKDGQYLTIYNEDDNAATFAGQTIAPLTGVMAFDYINGAWRLVSDNQVGTSNNFVKNQNSVDQPANFRINGSGSVLGSMGVGTSSPNTALDVNGALSLREGQVISLANGGASGGTNDNITLPDISGSPGVKASFYRITGPSAAFSIYGIVPVSNSDGQMVTLVNTTSNAMTIKNNASSVSANSIKTLTGGDITSVAANSSVTLHYNKTDGRWYVTATQNFTVASGSLATKDIVPGTGSAVTVTNGAGQVVGGGNVVLDVATNGLNQKGIVPGPTGLNGNQGWITDGSGNPAWAPVNSAIVKKDITTSTSGVTLSNNTAQVVGGSNVTIDVATNSAASPGLVLAGSGNNNKVWGTNGSGTPSWGSVSNAQLANSSVTINPGTGISGGGTVALGGSVTVTNAAPDQTVVLNNGTGISVTGSYPNFTITNTAPSSGGTVTGSGTINYVPKWTPSGTALGNSQIFDNGSNVGVGNTGPQHQLSVGAATSDAQAVTVRGYSNSPASWKGGAAFGYTSATVIMGELGGVATIGGHNSTLSAWGNLAINPSGGNVGIGTSGPNYKLDVNGSFRTAVGNLTIFDDYIYVSPTNNNTLNSGYSSNGVSDMWINYRGYNDAFTQVRNFNIGDGRGANIAWFDGTNHRMSINNGQTANYPLDVVGDINSSTGYTVAGGATSGNYLRGNGGQFVSSAIQPGDLPNGIGNAWQRVGTNVSLINTGDNVGIGTTTPANKLQISAGDGSLVLFGPNATWSSYLYVGAATSQVAAGRAQVISTNGNLHLDAGIGENIYVAYYNAANTFINPNGGNVGVGTTSPNGKLDIYNSGANGDGAVMAPDITTDNNFTIQTYIDANIGGGGWANRVAYAGGCCNNLALQPDIGTVSVGGTSGNFGANKFNVIGQSYFSGNVGIGTTGPAFKLDVFGDARVGETSARHYLKIASSSYGEIRYSNGSHDEEIRLGLADGGNYGANNGDWYVYSSGVNRMDLIMPRAGGVIMANQGGNVGIGTAAPNAKVDISSNGGSDGITMGQLNGDNSETIQTYIDGQYANRVNYAGGCCNALLLQPDVGVVGIGTTSPNGRLDVASNVANNGVKDGIVLYQQADNTNTIQTYIDGHWSDRTTYAGGCCNALLIQPDVGMVGIGTTSPDAGYKLDVDGGRSHVNYSRAAADWGGALQVLQILSSAAYLPSIAFHWPGNYASQLSLLNNGGLVAMTTDGSTGVPFYAQSFNGWSDINIKKDIKPLEENDFQECLNSIEQIRSIKYRFKNESENAQPGDGSIPRQQLHLGFEAQSLPKEVYSELLNGSSTGIGKEGLNFKGYGLVDMDGLLVAGVKALDKNQTTIKSDMQEMQKQLTEQKQIIEQLKLEIEELRKK